MAAMSEELSGQSQQLASALSFFKLTEGDRGASKGTAEAPAVPPPLPPSLARAKRPSRAIAPLAKADDDFEAF